MPDLKPKQHWFIRYKLYHIPFWMLYNYVFWALYTGSAYEAAHEMYFSALWVKAFFYTIFPAFAVYFNLYFLIPRYLQKGQYGLYIFFLALIIIASSFLIVPGYFVSAWLAGSNAKKYFGITSDWSGFYNAAKTEPLKSTIAAITLGMSIKLTKNWIETQRRQQALEKEKLETELKFLKYQFNPHFLFNSINSIFFLIHKNPDMASASLAKFSELLRHQLYECNDEQIPLSKEVTYLENFIELEKLRQSPSLQVNVNIDEGYSSGTGIAPFILMTFVENAFKHVSKHKTKSNWINIDLVLAGTQLSFTVSNSAAKNESRDVVNYGGIGLKNVQRRLDLVYPGQYQLDIQDNQDAFLVKLDLQLSAITINPSVQLITE
ncbi:sensor histidine kinase [Mucilaginibacter sp. BT774]|uniref:sensor histidine kinase n=1 Tax=Mucilaginibacter sp. BT774 TaxID=3062276 RepID=UPI00267556BA|nr:histidine kinase [Mucilaginibacter sp. BT774]MDO3626424.1 histidine kinase [Mucilaginibacter sp. BT774]